MMQRVCSILILMMFFGAAAAIAGDAETVYVEGFPELRDSGGRLADLYFGDRVRGGESIITGSTDRVELELEDGNTVAVSPDTVFTMRDYEEGGQTRTGLSNSRGAVTYRFNVLTGRQQPRVQSANAVAGVRGTVFTVFAGDDGSSLFVVEEGRIAVEAQGREVDVDADFAVEVRVGDAPGEPFEVLRGAIDFSGWNNGRIEALLESPVRSAEGALRRMEELVSELETAVDEYLPLRAELGEARAEAARIFEEDGQEAANEYRAEFVRPLEQATPRRYLNVRYWALSTMSLRRHVFGRMYSLLKSTYFLQPDNADWRGYLEVHNRALDLFDQSVVEYLVAADV